MNLAEQQEAHKERRQRWMMTSRKTNLVVEEKKRIEEYKKAEREAWLAIQQQKAKAEEAVRVEVAKRQELVETITEQRFETHAELTASFSDYQNPTIIHIPGQYVRRTMMEIAKDVLRNFPGVSLAQVQGIQRQREIMLARRHVIATIRMQRPDLSTPMIGRFVKKDHSTCLHAINKFVEDISKSNRVDRSGEKSE